MGFFDAFIEIKKKDDKPQASTQTPSPSVNTAIPSSYYQDSSYQEKSGSDTQVSQDGVKDKLDYFRKLLNDANLPGPDIKEFIDSVSDMNDMGDAKYAIVWKILSKNGLTWEKVEQSYNVYIKKIQDSSVAFNELIKSSEETDIQGSKERITNITKEKEDLQRKLALLDKESAELERKINETGTKLSQNMKDFEFAKNQFINLLTETYERIKAVK